MDSPSVRANRPRPDVHFAVLPPPSTLLSRPTAAFASLIPRSPSPPYVRIRAPKPPAPPSGRVVSQQYDAIGRLNQIASGGTSYLSSVTYNAAHQSESFNYGNGVVADPAYNSRLHLASLTYTKNTTKLLDLAYSYTSATHSGNNGQITKVQDNTGTAEAGRTVDYTYDAWSRLKTAVTTGSTSYPQWGLSWDYDRYGNLKNQNVTHGTAPALSLGINPLTNRISDTGFSYDSSGNLTADALNTYTYDAENRIKTMNGTGATYAYDGAGLRVKKVTGAQSTRYIFSGTKVVAEYSNGVLSTEYIYAGSQLLATLNSSGTPTYVHPDHLSARVFTDSGGTKIGERGHLPFGEIRYDTLPASKWKFTTYERDSESSLDYAIFRYHSSRLGRFQSPDPLAGTIRNPQSLNRYAYVLNDPISLTDPLGLAVECVTVCFWSPDPGDPSGFSGTFWCRTTCSGSYGPTPPQDIGLGFWYDSIAMLWDLIAGGFGPGVGPVPPPPGAMPPPPPIHCSKKFREMAAAAWMKAGGGIKRGEAGFQVRGSTAVPTYVPQPYTNEPHKISGWDIHENTVLVFHTHPNSGSPYPLGLDQEVRRPGGSLVPVYAGSSKGLYVTDPSDPKGYRLLREGLDWVDPCP